jgi:hypothetical protein
MGSGVSTTPDLRLGQDEHTFGGYMFRRSRCVVASSFTLAMVLVWGGAHTGVALPTQTQVAPAVPQPAPQTAPSLLAYADLQKTDFFKFFNVHEVASEAQPSGGTLLKLKTGGFQESVDLELMLDASRNITVARLYLTRGWVGNGQHVNPFATDIASSFLTAFSAPEDLKQVRYFADGLRELHGTGDQVIHLNPVSEPASLTPPDVALFLDTFKGASTDFTAEMSRARLDASNSTGTELQRLLLLVTATPSPNVPEAKEQLDPLKHGGTLIAQANVWFALTGDVSPSC